MKVTKSADLIQVFHKAVSDLSDGGGASLHTIEKYLNQSEQITLTPGLDFTQQLKSAAKQALAQGLVKLNGRLYTRAKAQETLEDSSDEEDSDQVEEEDNEDNDSDDNEIGVVLAEISSDSDSEEEEKQEQEVEEEEEEEQEDEDDAEEEEEKLNMLDQDEEKDEEESSSDYSHDDGSGLLRTPNGLGIPSVIRLQQKVTNIFSNL